MIEPQILDEKHPRMIATIEKMAQRSFFTPDFLKLQDRVRQMHESLALRRDDTAPFGPFNRLPATCLLVGSPTYYGKTYSIGRGIDALVPVVTTDGQEIAPKVLRYKCSPNANVASFLNGLLRAAGYPLNRDLPAGAAASRIAPLFEEERYTLLHIDEFQWALNPTPSPGRSRVQDENLVWNVIHAIIDSSEWPTPTVLSGLPAVIDSFNLDTDERQAVRSRFEVMSMNRLVIGNAGDAEAIVKLYCTDVGVTPEIARGFALGKRLVHASNYTLGIVLLLARLAIARAALRPDRILKADDFVDAYATKMDCSLQANPFHADDWRDIDPTLAMARTADQRRPEKQGKCT